MARIRSVHPGLFTDEAFVSLSDAAQVLLIGLWTECDDQGAFEWKPLSIRMRLRPNRDGSVEPLLAEMEALNCIMSYEHKGRKIGLVRNFRKWQRPKKPNKVYFVPPEFGTYTLPDNDSSELDADEQDEVPNSPHLNGDLVLPKAELVPNSPPIKEVTVPPKAELSPQREDGGWRMEEIDEGGRKEGRESPSAAAPSQILDSKTVEAVTAAWNNLAVETGLAKVQMLSKPRKTALRNGLASIGGLEGWFALCDKIRGSPFLLGQNDRGWKATFDWVLKPANLAKTMEGNYERTRKPQLRSTLESLRDCLPGADGGGDPGAGPTEAGDGIYPPDHP